jgi:hypothetical protein
LDAAFAARRYDSRDTLSFRNEFLASAAAVLERTRLWPSFFEASFVGV